MEYDIKNLVGKEITIFDDQLVTVLDQNKSGVFYKDYLGERQFVSYYFIKFIGYKKIPVEFIPKYIFVDVAIGYKDFTWERKKVWTRYNLENKEKIKYDALITSKTLLKNTSKYEELVFVKVLEVPLLFEIAKNAHYFLFY